MKASNYHQITTDNITKLCNRAGELGFIPLQQNKIVPLCLHNLISNTLQLIKMYVRIKAPSDTFSQWILDHFSNKYHKKSSCNRAFYTHMRSWKKYLEKSGQLRLCMTFLSNQKGRQQILKHFLKIRKQITKGKIAILDQITLNQEETIAIIHTLFNQPKRKHIIKKMNDSYLCLQQKHTVSKLQSTALCEFLIKQFEQMEVSGFEFKISKQNRIKPQQFVSQIYDDNGIVGPSSKRKSLQASAISKRTIESSRIYKNKRSKSKSMLKAIFPSDQIDSQQEKSLKDMNKYSSSNGSPGRAFNSQKNSYVSNFYYPYDSNPSYQNRNQPSIAQYITQKYSEDWSRMIQINQQFKSRILQKTIDQFESLKNPMSIQTYYCIDPSHQLYNKDTVQLSKSSYQSIQQQDAISVDKIQQSPPRKSKKFFQ